MRKKSTRLLSAALAACMMLSVLPVGAFAAEPGAEEQENGASAQADAAVPEGYIAINDENFPDENFRDYVAGEWDKNQDKYFSPSEIANAKWISCDNKEISNLKGIEFFTNIWLLECYYNNLTTIDLSHNKKLSYINCHHNQLNELDVSGLPLLETFYCGHNALLSIDVSKNEKLEDFNCQNNHLDTLNVSQNKELVKLGCGSNNLTELDVSENKKLKTLGCYENKLRNLNLGNQIELEWLSCGTNPLSVLDVSANTKLKELYVSKTNLTSLDAKNHTALATFVGKDCSYNIAVEGDGKFDLTTLPGHFDASKATATRGGTINENENILTVDPNSKTFRYDYDIGQNQKLNVVLNVHWHNYQWQHDGTKHWRECTTANCPGLTAEQVAKTTHDYTDAKDNDCNTCGYVRPLYTVTTGENVTAKLGDEVLDAPVAADTKVHLTATVPEGKRFTGWTVKVGGEEKEADTFLTTPDKNDPTKATFTMPSENVEVTANFASNPTLNPTLRVGDHVTATIEGSDASVPSGSTVPVPKNKIVHLTATAPGQHFISWTVKVNGVEQDPTFLKPDADDPTKVTFIMPDANVEVTATFADDPIPEPDPVGPSDTGNIQGAISAVVIGAAAGAIIYEAGTGIYRVINMPGIPMPSNRIELAELLWEHAGKPEPVSTALYSDIDEGDTDAQKAARWAVEQDLMKDDADNNKFHPAFPVSKLRTCLTWNAAKEKGLFDKTEE